MLRFVALAPGVGVEDTKKLGGAHVKGSRIGVIAALAASALCFAACSSTSSSSTPTTTSEGNTSTAAPNVFHIKPAAALPKVQGPITAPGKSSLTLSEFPLSSVGYSQSEYFFSGTATSYSSTTPLTSNGKWSVEPAATAPYKSRMVIARPSDPSKFSGTVIVEWLNVTDLQDAAVDWTFGHDQMIRSGDVYVGVSAQVAGIDQAKTVDPARYGSLDSPGDSFSYDIYSQAAMALRRNTSTLLPGLHPKVFIADGESQSAYRMVTYVDAVAPVAQEFDSYMIHSTGSGGNVAPLSAAPEADVATPPALQIRTDLGVPVLEFETETDVLGPLNFYPATQPDSSHYRLWEVAGTSHADTYESLQAGYDNLTWPSDLAQFSSMSSPPSSITVDSFSLNCPDGFNTGEQHYVFNTALNDLSSWATTGTAPKSMPRFDIDTSTSPPTYRLDKVGNVEGGLRTPAVDTPVARLSGLPAPGGGQFCEFFGQTHPLKTSELAKLYPTTSSFSSQWKASVSRDEAAGYLLAVDAAKLAASPGT